MCVQGSFEFVCRALLSVHIRLFGVGIQDSFEFVCRDWESGGIMNQTLQKRSGSFVSVVSRALAIFP